MISNCQKQGGTFRLSSKKGKYIVFFFGLHIFKRIQKYQKTYFDMIYWTFTLRLQSMPLMWWSTGAWLFFTYRKKTVYSLLLDELVRNIGEWHIDDTNSCPSAGHVRFMFVEIVIQLIVEWHAFTITAHTYSAVINWLHMLYLIG